MVNSHRKLVSVCSRIRENGPHSTFESKIIKIIKGENDEVEFLEDKL